MLEESRIIRDKLERHIPGFSPKVCTVIANKGDSQGGEDPVLVADAKETLEWSSLLLQCP